MHAPTLRAALLILSGFCLALCAAFYAAFFIAPQAFAPSGESAWRGYVVLYVSEEFSEQTVLDLCAQEKIGGVITLADQKPFAPPRDALMGNLNALFLREDFARYEQKRANFFFDKERKFRLFYVEGQSARRLLRVAARIRERGAECGVNVSQTRSFAVMIICAVVYLVFCLAAKNRLVMALGGVFIACFSFFTASENAGACAVLALYSLFLLQKTGLRKGFFWAWLKKIPNTLSLIISLPLICVQPGFLPFYAVACGQRFGALPAL